MGQRGACISTNRPCAVESQQPIRLAQPVNRASIREGPPGCVAMRKRVACVGTRCPALKFLPADPMGINPKDYSSVRSQRRCP